jgi:predicted alpha/beta hydrolase
MMQDPRAARPAFVHPAARAGTPVILGLPAMGTPASYYEPFAAALAAATGAAVAFADLRGQGSSPYRARRGDHFGYREIIEEDLPALVDHLCAAHPGRPLVLLGHSLGGQLATLAAHQFAGRLKGLVLVAAGTAHHRAWPGARRHAARLAVAAIAFTARVLPWYPGHLLGFGGEQPRRLMRDWTVNATTGQYAIEGARAGHQWATQCLDVPVLSLAVRDDPVAPHGAREELLARLESATVTREAIDGVLAHTRWRRHFSWARQPQEAVSRIAPWVQALASGREVHRLHDAIERDARHLVHLPHRLRVVRLEQAHAGAAARDEGAAQVPNRRAVGAELS